MNSNGMKGAIMYGLILFEIICLLVSLLVFRLRRIKWSSTVFGTIILMCIFGIIYILVGLQVFQNILPREWKEVDKVYLEEDCRRILTAAVTVRGRLGEVFIFSPVVGHNALLTTVSKTDCIAYNGGPFLVKYQLGLAVRYKGWFIIDKPVRWQAYLPPGTLVAGERI